MDKGFLGYNFDKYKLQNKDSVSIGVYFEYGGCEYEFAVEWICLKGCFIPCLRVFNDAWKGLYKEHMPLLKALADNYNKDISPKKMKKLLNKLGYIDTDKIQKGESSSEIY